MEQKLKLVFQDHRLALALKAVVYTGLLAFASIDSPWTVLRIAVYLWGSFFISRAIEGRAPQTRGARIVLILASLLLGRMLAHTGVGIVFFFLSGILFYLLIGLRSLSFIQRYEWNYVLRLLITYVLALMLFFIDASAYFFISMWIVFMALLWVWREFLVSLDVSSEKQVYAPRALVFGFAGMIALLFLEGVWVAKLLPLSVINAANLTFLITFAMSSLLVRNMMGVLSRKYILNTITLFVFAVISIFIISHWNI